MKADTATHPCRECKGTGRVDEFTARVQAAAHELRLERLGRYVLAARLGAVVREMTDAELADVLESTVLAETPYDSPDWDAVQECCKRLRRANGGPLEDDEHDRD